MSKFHIIIFSLLIFAIVAFSAQLTLIGDSSFAYGSSCWQELSGEYFYRPALLNNNSETIFIAQMPDSFLNGTNYRHRFRSIHKNSPLTSTTEEIIAGYDEIAFMLGSKLSFSNWNILSASNHNAFFGIIEKETGGETFNSSTYIFYKNNNKLIEEPLLSALVLQNAQLTVSGSGKLLAITDGNLSSPIFYEFENNKFIPRQFPEDIFFAYNKKDIAINPDGTRIYFVSTENLSASDSYIEGHSSLYAYDTLDESYKLVSLLQNDDSQVQCAAEAEIAVFRNANKLIIAEARKNSGFSLQQIPSGQFSNPQAARISSDGRFIVFTATPADHDFQQIYRYDRLRETLTEVSKNSTGAWSTNDCYAPSISPNGRYVSFVSKANNLGAGQLAHPQLWLADLGPSLLPIEINSYQDDKVILPLEISGGSSDTKISLSPNTQNSFITFYDKDNEILQFGKQYQLNSLPWSFLATENYTGQYQFFLHLSEGNFSDDVQLKLHIFSKNEAIISCMSLDESSAYISSDLSSFSDISCDETANKLAFVTSLPLLHKGGTSYHAYLRDSRSGELKRINDSTLQLNSKIVISGNSEIVLYTASGNLWQYTVRDQSNNPLASGAIDNIKPAINYDASIIAYSKNKQLQLLINNEAPYCPAPDLQVKDLKLNRDGKVLAILTTDNELYLYCLDAEEEHRLLLFEESIEQFTMNQNGLEFYFIQNNNLHKRELAAKESKEVTLPEGISASTLQNLQLSGNGRFLSWIRDYHSAEETFKDQQFLYDITNEKEILLSGTELEPGDGPCSIQSPTALSSSGRKIFFASLASNLTPNDDNSTQDLFLAELPELELDTIEIINTVLNAIEDEDNVLPIQFFSANRNALLPILNSNNSTQNAEIKLLGPSAERTSYAIKYSPQDNFCGEDSFSLQVWDGSKLSDEIILTVKVENVNDAPYLKKEFPATQIAEGEIASFDLLEYFDDVDLYNPVRYMDEISFSLPKDAPDWLTIENNRLYLQPGYETVNNGEESKEFLLGVICTDLAGEFAELQLPITVNDVKIVSFNPAELWEYTTSSETPGAEPASWKQLYAGWNLLALPYAANQKEINTIFNENVTLWVWNKQQNKYKIANHLQAGQGFWIYLTTLENIKTKEITLENGRTTAAEIESGWNLQGNSWITQQIEIEEVIILQKNIWQKTDKIPQGKAAWILSK